MYKTILIILLACAGSAAAQAPAVIAAKVEMFNGRPMIMLNGKPEYPAIYALTDVPGGRWSWEELPAYNMRSFCEQGFRLIQVDLSFDHVWKEDGSVQIDTARLQLAGVLKNCANAAIMIRFHVNPPKWWQAKFPAENTLYLDTTAKPDISWGLQRYIEDDEETPVRTSIASTRWLREASEKLGIFLSKLQSLPEANAIMGIQVAGGVYGEWHYWGFIDNEPDGSEPMQLYFRHWLQNKYGTVGALQKSWNDGQVNFANARVPLLQERRTTRRGIFRDPKTERKTIDYYEAQHDCVADAIIHFCKLVKDSWPRPVITGAFYGYFYAVFGREAAGGHLQLQKVLNSPYIDFLCGPNTYYPAATESGDAYRSRSLINSVALHGKLWLDEMDQQPPLAPLKDTSFNTSLLKSIATVRRNMLFTYTKGMGLWFYDFGPSGFNGGKRLADHGSFGWWDEPSLRKDIGRMKKIMENKMLSPYASGADVLLVHDTKTLYYTGSARAQSYMGHWTNNWLPPAIFKSGVVHDVIDIHDLDKIAIDRYKVIVFMNTWVLNEQQKKLIKTRAAKDNRHLVFLYAPGYSNEQELNRHFIESVTGMDLQQLETTKRSVLVMKDTAFGDFSTGVFNNTIDPLFAVADKNAETLGTLKDSTAVLFARKSFPAYTSWFISVPPADATFWRYLFEQCGAHIYNGQGDVLYNGGGILVIHTAVGGPREILLPGGKKINVNLLPHSTTLIDPETGELIL